MDHPLAHSINRDITWAGSRRRYFTIPISGEYRINLSVIYPEAVVAEGEAMAIAVKTSVGSDIPICFDLAAVIGQEVPTIAVR
jgi:hypothetical protein